LIIGNSESKHVGAQSTFNPSQRVTLQFEFTPATYA